MTQICVTLLNRAKSFSVVRYDRGMRTTKTLSITLPPDMLARAEEIARKEHRTMSELVREALRQYERTQWWDSMNAYGRTKADELGLTEADVVSAVNDVRARRRRQGKKRPEAK